LSDLLEGFEAWWEAHGQYCRAGGGEYEKTFAFRAWEAAEQRREEHRQEQRRQERRQLDEEEYRRQIRSACGS